MSKKPVPLSLRKKSSARLAAVQCAYRLRMDTDAITPPELFDDYMAQWYEDKASKNRAMSFDVEPDRMLFMKLITGIMEHKEEIDQIIKGSLNEKWTLERMSPVLVSIIACGVYEMKYLSKLKPVVVINEYVTLAGRFFDEDEVGFVNGLLDTLAKK